MSEWQPIETAPTDYTEVIGINAKGNISRTWFFAPSSRTQNWLKIPNNTKWNPTHWMPIPSPPEGFESGANAAANSPAPEVFEASPTRTDNTSEIGK